ncbi:hypothetical protein [Burkholderia gladioli]|uniref:hypothetical protein n=1 Tax=Burkholderia gladioli TaxID=28095 RepID=UPI001C5F95FE|nr:hypothetical protein [Burkholderia gladioli]MBW5286719.1 hypothetical protein [Burkholderia gladioli]
MAAGIEWRLFRVWLAFLAIVAFGSFMIASWIVAGIGAAALIGLFYFLRNTTRDDPLARRKYLRYARQADAYEPWPQIRKSWTGATPNGRPFGFGRDRLL